MRIAIRHYDGSITIESDAPNETSTTIIRQTKYGPMRFVRSGEIWSTQGGCCPAEIPLFVVPKPAEPEALETVWSGGELLEDRATLPDTRWETLGAAIFGEDNGKAA